MWLAMLCAPALGTELAFELTTSEDLEVRWKKDHKEAWTEQYGPFAARGKRRVRYDVTVMPSVFDPLENAFQTTVTLCRYWWRKSDRNRDCVEDLLLIPGESVGPVAFAGKVRGTDKFDFTLLAVYLGPPPTAVGLPGEQQPEVAEPEPEVVAEEEVPAEEPEPEKDEMATALEDIASGILQDLGNEESEDEDEDE